jgi:transcription initiation factor TFIID TATA-box-binding protein
MLKIVSMVIICTFDQPFHLQYLSKNIDGARLPNKGGSWVKLRLKPENYYIAFYKSGKILITGVKSLKKIANISQRILKILDEVGVHGSITKIETVNIVCLGTLQLNTTLEKIVFYLDSPDASYEPEQFPGLIYKNWGATFLIFSTGKVILTGVREFEEAKTLFEKLEKLINVQYISKFKRKEKR